jgi:hypothetical protein
VWSKGSSTSSSSTSTRSHSSSHTQDTNITSYSYDNTKPTTKQYVTCEAYEVAEEPLSYEEDYLVDPRASSETYASTIADEEKPDSQRSLNPLMRSICYQPDAISTTPAEFAELFPSTRRLLIQHDDTSPDGNLNLRLDTELTISRGHRVKLTLFHLRMYDLVERQFSLRRYQRQSGREVCSSKRKYLKPISKPSLSSKKGSIVNALTKMNLKAFSTKPRPKPSYEPDDTDSEDDVDLFDQADVEASIPTETMRLEFSNYAQVELQRTRRGDGKVYDFEYWGQQYTWRKVIYQDEKESIFSFELVNLASGNCLAHITPDKLSRQQSRHEASQGTWVPPCSMRVTEKGVSGDLGDVIIATGLMALTDDCIRGHWREAHRS